MESFTLSILTETTGYRDVVSDVHFARLRRRKWGVNLLTCLFGGGLVFLYMHQASGPLSPFEWGLTWGLGVVVLIGGLYFNSQGWRRFNDAVRLRTAAAIGTDPDALSKLMRDAKPLLASDPQAAAQLLHAHFDPLKQQEHARREELLARAAAEPSAALTLSRTIEDQIAKDRAAIAELSLHKAAHPGVALVVTDLHTEISELEARLAEIAHLLPRG